MFENLTERLSNTLRHITGKAKLTENNIEETLNEVRKALLEADVALEVVSDFVAAVRENAIGKEVTKGLSSGQFFLKIVKDELTKIMGDESKGLDLKSSPPAVILMAGLQGSGKTTTVAKLAKFLQEKHNKKVMSVSLDIYRPAAIDQLEHVINQVGAEFFKTTTESDPVEAATHAIQEAKRFQSDVLIVDTAGRLHIDDKMMTEVKNIHQAIKPAETLFVVDSMTGQDAARTAKAFNDALPLTGVVLSKIDGDARGGAALSIRHLTQKPIKFLGVGEKLDALELFHPDRVASRIIGMGDVFSLIEDIESKVDKKEAEKLAKKVGKGQFDFSDLKMQLMQMKNMGGLSGIMDKMPGMAGMQSAVKDKVNDTELTAMIAVIDSMTKKERVTPNLLINKAMKGSSSRKRRIAQGSGRTIQEVNKALKMHQQMQKMMKKFSGKGLGKMMKGLQGKLPPGMQNMLPPGMMDFNDKK